MFTKLYVGMVWFFVATRSRIVLICMGLHVLIILLKPKMLFFLIKFTSKMLNYHDNNWFCFDLFGTSCISKTVGGF